MAGVLEQVKVLEVANFIAGPYVGLLLADLGAEVIKIEEPGKGDPFRSWGEGLYSPHYVAYNRNKRSVTLNLREPEGVAVLRRLAATADVLVENFRPGVADRLGFGYSALHAINPRLIYCSLSGFGDSGPYVNRPAYDGVVQGISGLMSQVTDASDPRPAGPAFCDSLSGLFACQGILGALYFREQSGMGQRVVVPMLGASVSFLRESFGKFFMLGEVPGPRRNVAQVYAFVCADQRALVLHLSSPQKFWQGLLAVISRPELATDPRFADRDARAKHYDELEAILREIFRLRPRAAWLEALQAQDVPAGPVNTLPDVMADPQVQHLGLEVEMEWPEGVAPVGALRTLASPLQYSATPVPVPTAPPVLGADTEAILAAAGLSCEEIASLQSRRVI